MKKQQHERQNVSIQRMLDAQRASGRTNALHEAFETQLTQTQGSQAVRTASSRR